MIKFIKSLLGYPTEAEKTAAKQATAEAPYKVEAPEAKVEAVNAQPIAKTTKAKAPAKPKAPAKTKAPAKAPAKPKAPAKAPAKPRAPKKTK